MAIQVASGAAEDYLKRKEAPAMGESWTPPAETPMVRPNANPTPAPAPTTTPAFRSTSGDNVKSYIDQASANLGKDPGAISEAGKIYADRVTSGLKTPDASSVNAQNTEDTNAARRAYLARVDADERVGQSGFSLGSAQATRIADQSQAGVNAANQAGQSAVNAYIRQRTEDNMNRAKDLETQQYGRNRDVLRDAQGQDLVEYSRSENATDRAIQASEIAYGRGRDAVMDSRYTDETTYNRGENAKDRAERLEDKNWERGQVIQGNNEAAKRNLLNSLPEGPAKNAANAMLSQGKTPAEVLAAIFNPDGSVVEAYRGKSTVQLGQDALREEAILALQTEAQANGTMFDPNSPDGIKAVATKINDLRKTKSGPVDDETKARTLEEASARLANLPAGQKPAQEDLDALPSVTPQAIPQGSATASWLAESTTGGWVKIGGKAYKVTGGDSYVTREGEPPFTSDLHDDYVIMQDENGNPAYITDTGKIVTERPKKGWESTQK